MLKGKVKCLPKRICDLLNMLFEVEVGLRGDGRALDVTS